MFFSPQIEGVFHSNYILVGGAGQVGNLRLQKVVHKTPKLDYEAPKNIHPPQTQTRRTDEEVLVGLGGVGGGDGEVGGAVEEGDRSPC